MEKQKIEPSVGKEMNFWDLCVTIGRAIGRLGIACWRVAHTLNGYACTAAEGDAAHIYHSRFVTVHLLSPIRGISSVRH